MDATQYKTLRAAQRAFSRTAEQVVVDLRLTTDEHHLLDGLKDEVTLKKNPEKTSTKKVVEEVAIGETPKSDGVFYADYSSSSKKDHKKPKGEPSSLVLKLPLF